MTLKITRITTRITIAIKEYFWVLIRVLFLFSGVSDSIESHEKKIERIGINIKTAKNSNKFVRTWLVIYYCFSSG